jgi:uncharacterized protein
VKLEQSFDIAQPRGKVWLAFANVKATASCIPGADITDVADANHAQGTFRVQMGPIKAAFDAEAELSRDDATHSGTIVASGKDNKTANRFKSTVTYKVVELAPDRTRVDLEVDYTLSGPLAQFGRSGIVKEIAANISKLFAHNLEAQLNVTAPDPSETASATHSAGAPSRPVEDGSPMPSASPPQSLNMWSILLSVLRSRIARLFARS